MCTSARRQYFATTAAPASAREFGAAMVIASLNPAGWRLADDVEIVVSELVTESLGSAAESISVAIDMHYDRLALVVVDDRPAAGPDPEDTSDGTRRLILDRLTDRLETTRERENGTVTRASITCDPRWTTKVPCALRPAQS
jgi:hypothetical protein